MMGRAMCHPLYPDVILTNPSSKCGSSLAEDDTMHFKKKREGELFAGSGFHLKPTKHLFLALYLL